MFPAYKTRASEIPDITADASCDRECTFPVPGGLWVVGAAFELFASTALKVTRNIKISDPDA
jgi:hypothetical protein